MRGFRRDRTTPYLLGSDNHAIYRGTHFNRFLGLDISIDILELVFTVSYQPV